MDKPIDFGFSYVSIILKMLNLYYFDICYNSDITINGSLSNTFKNIIFTDTNNYETNSLNYLDNHIHKIYEPILFNLDCDNKSFVQELKIIGKRQQKDLVILRNYKKIDNIESIVENTYHCNYYFDYYNLMVVLTII